MLAYETEALATEAKAETKAFSVVMGRCRYFASVSVFVFLVGFYKSRFGFRYRSLKISDIGSVFRFLPARVFAIATCPYVRLSVRLSHAGIVPSRAKAGS